VLKLSSDQSEPVYFGIREQSKFEERLNMLCQELERLESQFVRIREQQREPGVTDEQRGALEEAEIQMTMTIKDHKAFGHDGKRCFGE
jgi:hypothetical protein